MTYWVGVSSSLCRRPGPERVLNNCLLNNLSQEGKVFIGRTAVSAAAVLMVALPKREKKCIFPTNDEKM